MAASCGAWRRKPRQAGRGGLSPRRTFPSSLRALRASWCMSICRPRATAPRTAVTVVSKPVVDRLGCQFQSLRDVLYGGAFLPGTQDRLVLEPVESRPELCDRFQRPQVQLGVLGAAKKRAWKCRLIRHKESIEESGRALMSSCARWYISEPRYLNSETAILLDTPNLATTHAQVSRPIGQKLFTLVPTKT